jgi:hypothetical protein
LTNVCTNYGSRSKTRTALIQASMDKIDFSQAKWEDCFFSFNVLCFSVPFFFSPFPFPIQSRN